MSNQEKLLKKLGFNIEDLEKEDFDIETAIKSFYDSKLDVYLSKPEIKEKINNARNDGKIIGIKDFKKALKRKYDLDISIDEPDAIDDILEKLDLKANEKLEKSKGSETEQVQKLKAEIEEWKEKLMNANKEKAEILEKKEIEKKEIETSYIKQIRERDKMQFITSDLSKEDLIISKEDAIELFLTKLSKKNLHLEIEDNKPVIKNEKGEKVLNSIGTSHISYEELKEEGLAGLRKQSNGGNEPPIKIKTDNLSLEQKLMMEHLQNM
jgi:hypothetical protein